MFFCSFTLYHAKENLFKNFVFEDKRIITNPSKPCFSLGLIQKCQRQISDVFYDHPHSLPLLFFAHLFSNVYKKYPLSIQKHFSSFFFFLKFPLGDKIIFTPKITLKPNLKLVLSTSWTKMNNVYLIFWVFEFY